MTATVPPDAGAPSTDRTDTRHRKVAIIGSGPAGLTAAIYAGRANLEPLVIAGNVPMGQLMITSDVENYPGFPDGVQGPELMQKFREQAERFGATLIEKDATKVDFSERPFRIWINADEYRAENCFWVPKEARWSHLKAQAKQPTIGKTLDDAMLAIERRRYSAGSALRRASAASSDRPAGT